MSSQAGVFYFDLRPVPGEVAHALVNSLGATDVDARSEFCGAGVFMTHAASWIDDLARTERQPHTSASGNTITFDGRLDSREDLLLRLRDRLRGDRTDCALASTAYDAWGIEGLVYLIGDWSIAVCSPGTHSVTLASDYAGVRPLYHHVNHERVLWSSHLKPLIALTGVTEIDDQFVAGFLTGGASPSRTPYRGIFSVPAGHALRFGVDGVQSHTFWQLPVHNQIRYQSDDQYDEQLRALFRESVRARLRTSHPVYSELSGGLDSSSIVCMASHLIANRAAESPRIVSVSFGPPGAADEKFYTAVQNFCGIEGQHVDTGDFPFLSLDYLDEASPAPWGALFTELTRRAKRLDARVYLTGQGGDMMMGNWVDDSIQLAGRLRRGQIGTALTEAVGWSKATRLPAPTLLWRGLLASLPSELPISSRYEAHANGAIPERFGDSLTPQFKSRTGLTNPDWIWSQRWKDAPPERRKHFRSVSKVLESGFFRPPERFQHLYYTHPYSHRPLVEFLLSIPPDVLCKPGEPRRLMRRAFRELLPSEVTKRRSKASFTGEFLKSVRPAVRALLADSQSLFVAEHGYVDGADVRQRLDRITQSLDCNEPQLRQIVLLELWLRARSRQFSTQFSLTNSPTLAAANLATLATATDSTTAIAHLATQSAAVDPLAAAHY